MAWVRIHDGAMSHPKLVSLIDWRNPFCVWVWGLSYCQLHLTDGLIPIAAVPNPKALKTAAKLVEAGAWEPIVAFGFKVHDYLQWNDSRETVLAKREGAKTRLDAHRLKRVSSLTSATLLARSGVGITSSSSEEKEDALTMRAGDLLNRYAELFYEHRRGARYHARPALDFPKACELVQTWTDDARLEKLAVIVLTTDDDWISRTDRGFGIFAAKATWADERLAAWEAEKARTA